MRHVKEGIETERFRTAQTFVKITFIAAGLGQRLLRLYIHKPSSQPIILLVLGSLQPRNKRLCPGKLAIRQY